MTTSELGSGTGGPPLTELAPLLGFLSQESPSSLCPATICSSEQFVPSEVGVRRLAPALDLYLEALFYLAVELRWEKLETDCAVVLVQ